MTVLKLEFSYLCTEHSLNSSVFYRFVCSKSFWFYFYHFIFFSFIFSLFFLLCWIDLKSSFVYQKEYNFFHLFLILFLNKQFKCSFSEWEGKCTVVGQTMRFKLVDVNINASTRMTFIVNSNSSVSYSGLATDLITDIASN